MKLTILMENESGRPGVFAEHGLCIYGETEAHRFLMDTGASELTVENALRLGVDLQAIDTVVISHGHYDHAGGLLSFAAHNHSAALFLHEKAFGSYYHGAKYIGMNRSIAALPRLHLIRSEELLDDELILFPVGGAPENGSGGNRGLSERIGGRLVPDRFEHEICLLVRDGTRRILFSGCAHNGIQNILRHYEERFHALPDAVISGFHMKQKTPYTDNERERILETARALASLPVTFYTGHCTGEEAYDMMKPILGDRLHRLRSGDTLIV